MKKILHVSDCHPYSVDVCVHCFPHKGLKKAPGLLNPDHDNNKTTQWNSDLVVNIIRWSRYYIVLLYWSCDSQLVVFAFGPNIHICCCWWSLTVFLSVVVMVTILIDVFSQKFDLMLQSVKKKKKKKDLNCGFMQMGG